MDPGQAAQYINKLRPQIAIPTHYGSIVGKPEDGEKFKEKADPEIEVRLLLSH